MILFDEESNMSEPSIPGNNHHGKSFDRLSDGKLPIAAVYGVLRVGVPAEPLRG